MPFPDSDWAGCKETRIRAIAGVLRYNGGVVKTWSKDQQLHSRSSAEAELYAAKLAAAQMIALNARLVEMG